MEYDRLQACFRGLDSDVETLKVLYRLSFNICGCGSLAFKPSIEFVTTDAMPRSHIPFHTRSRASQLGAMDDELAGYIDFLGASHAERLRAIRKQFEAAVSARVFISLSEHYQEHQELLGMLIDLLPSRAPVILTFLEGIFYEHYDGDWTILAGALARLNITELDARQKLPPSLVTAALRPGLRTLVLVGVFESVDWQPLQRCPLASLYLHEFSVNTLQAVLDNVAAPLQVLLLATIPAAPNTLVIPLQAVDGGTEVTLHGCHASVTFPPAAEIASYRYSGPLAISSVNVPVHLLCCHDLSQYPPCMLDNVFAVSLHELVPTVAQGQAFPDVQAVCINAIADNVADSLAQLAAFKQGEAWFATFPRASVLLLKIEFDHRDTRTAIPILLRNPAIPIGMPHYGSILRLCENTNQGLFRPDTALATLLPMLELTVALALLNQALPTDVFSSVLRAFLLTHYRTMWGATAELEAIRDAISLDHTAQQGCRVTRVIEHQQSLRTECRRGASCSLCC